MTESLLMDCKPIWRAGDWIEWNGGECPVEKGVDVEVRFRDETSESHKSEYFRWGHHSMTFYGNSSRDIIAYRVVDAPGASTESALTRQPGGTHYRDATIQPVQFIEANGLQFLEGCIVKRATRHDKPTGKGREDIEKIIHEAQLLLELRYGVAA